MADNVAITAGSGETIAADEVSGAKHQRVKLSLGADGTAVDAGAGAGAVSTDTQRVTLGSDDPAVASLAIVDDWDESDRAKVNLIVGQAGVAAGEGALGVTVQRMSVATDDRMHGPSAANVSSYTDAVVDLAAATANQVLVAAPGANNQIWVFGLFMMADTGAGTITLQDEDDTAKSGTMAVSDEGGFVLPPSGHFNMPWLKVATNKALEADTGGTATLDGIITYAVVDVS